ncbi:class I SAM-dependent methyltransferase [Tsuneonella mangrovi]|uniref:class I SAM-dependent methyltransferase n=1 Tax=Tsuneonella mangrovi TaxID=1982042 RepID=UPI000BA1C972|nr:class I SAM-dependent methyltransferase [Tsuneonella mangrovi]
MAGLEKRFSGNVPENYDRGLGPFIFDFYALQMAKRSARLNPGTVLETAAGTGIVTSCLRDKLAPGIPITVTDLNQPMLDYAAKKLEGAGALEFVAADACDLPFEDSQFDAVVCQFGIMFYPDRQASYEEVLRVLNPGGKYLFSVWNSWSENPFAEIAYEVGAEFVPHNPPSFYKVPFSYNDVDTIREALDLAGFGNSEVEIQHHTQTLSDPGLFARGLVYGNPLHNELLEREIDPEAVCGRMENVLNERLGASMPLSAIFVTATKN